MLHPVRPHEAAIAFVQRFASHRGPAQLTRSLTLFARHTSAATDPAAYLEARWSRYPEVCVAFKGQEIQAFTLVHPFSVDGWHYLYVGPMFSRGRAYIDLFASLVRAELGSRSQRPFHVAAEIEHPSVLGAFNTLFPSHQPRPPSASACDTALRFLAEVPHIGELDLLTFRTTIKDPLFVARETPCPSAQLVLISCDASLDSRNRLQNELEAGLMTLDRVRP